MLVTSELEHDPRVQKEALLATQAGFDVTVICRSYSGGDTPYQVVALNKGRRNHRFAKYIERLSTNVSLYRCAVETNPDIIHANDLDTLPSAYYAATRCQAALLYDAHELWSDMGEVRGGRMGKVLALHSERYFSRRASAVVTVSHYRGEAMSRALNIAAPTIVMNTPYYIAPEKLVRGAWLDEFVGKKVVLYQGRFNSSMGLLEAIQAAHYLPPEVVLVFRGFGPFSARMHEAINKEGLTGRVTIVPPVPMKDIVQSAVGATLGLVVYKPVNLNNLYAAPNKLFEFIMAGVPCVGSDLPYLREIICGQNLGLVFQAGDPRDLARAITELLDTPNRMLEMRQRCLEYARQCCWESEGSKLIQEYERLVTKKGCVVGLGQYAPLS